MKYALDKLLQCQYKLYFPCILEIIEEIKYIFNRITVSVRVSSNFSVFRPKYYIRRI